MPAQCLFLYFLKMSVNQRSSNVYKEYRNGTLGLNGFIKQSCKSETEFFTLHKIEVFHEVSCKLVTLTK